MQRVHDAHSVRGTVEEIGIAEADVLGARGHLLANVGEHHFRLHHAETALIYRHHGAMAAQMLAASAGFGIAGAFGRHLRFAGAAYLSRGGNSDRSGTWNCRRSSEISGSVCSADPAAGQPLHQRNQSGFELAAQNGRGAQAPQVRFVQRRVQSVAAEVRRRIQPADFLDHFGRQPRGRVHGQDRRRPDRLRERNPDRAIPRRGPRRRPGGRARQARPRATPGQRADGPARKWRSGEPSCGDVSIIAAAGCRWREPAGPFSPVSPWRNTTRWRAPVPTCS